MLRVLGTVALVLFSLSPASAQRVDEDQTRDYEQQDKDYYERTRRFVEAKAEADAEGTPEEIHERYVTKAQELLEGPSYRSRASEHYRIQTDDPRADLAATERLLESFRSFYSEFWKGKLELQPDDERSRVFLFYSFYKYNKLLSGDWTFSYVRPTGHYRRETDVLTMHTDSSDPGGFADTLIHEAAHQLLQRHVYTGEALPSRWISEGLATYFGHTLADKEGRFVAGKIGGKALLPVRNARRDPRSQGRSRLASLKDAKKDAKGERKLIRPIFIEDAGEFYGSAGWNYAASWVIVHFLLHADEGKHVPAFAAYLEAESRGEGGAEVLLQQLDITAIELERAVTAHLKTMRAR